VSADRIPDSSLPTLVWGAGAMGGSIGAWLLDAGHPVWFVDRDAAHVSAINTTGLHIAGPVRTFRVAARAFQPEELTGQFERILLCVKAHHTDSALQDLEPHLSDTGYLVSIQNGLNEPAIAATVGPDRTIGAFVNFGADLMEPGVVMRGNRGAVVVGELDGTDTDRVRELQGLLRAFEPDACVSENIFGYLWSKLAYGALLFATATTHLSIADALDAEPSRPFFVALGREVCAVAQAAGIRLEAFDGFDPAAFQPGGSDAEALASLAELVRFNRGSAKTHSGIWRDLAVRKRRTEADAQLGPVVRVGEEHGLDTPLTGAVHRMIREIESGHRPQTDANLAELVAGLS